MDVRELKSLELKAQRREELRGVIAMSIPMVVTTCTRMVMDVTDYMMVTALPGGQAQAALLPAQMFLWSFIVIGMGIVSIVATFSSQALGRGKYADCSAYAWQSLYVALAFGAVGVCLGPGYAWLIAAIGHEPKVQALELAYCNVAVWTIGPTIAAAGLSAFFNGVHHPKVTMWSAVEGIVINVVVSYCLIIGALGMPAMGIAGAAAGTVVATTYRCVRLTVTLCLPSFNEQFSGRKTWRLDLAKMKGIFRFGMPQGGQWFSDVVVWTIFTTLLVGRLFGTDHLTANNIAWQYLRMSFMPIIGVGMGLTSLVGKAVGQGDPERAVRQTRTGLLIATGYMVLLSIAYLVWRRELIGIFNNTPQIVAIGASIMICTALFQVFDGMGIIYTCALRGAGDTLWPSLMFVISHWVILIGGGTVMALTFPGLGSLGPWIAATTLLIICGLLLRWRWHKRAWMKIDIFRDEKAGEGASATTETPLDEALPEVVVST